MNHDAPALLPIILLLIGIWICIFIAIQIWTRYQIRRENIANDNYWEGRRALRETLRQAEIERRNRYYEAKRREEVANYEMDRMRRWLESQQPLIYDDPTVGLCPEDEDCMTCRPIWKTQFETEEVYRIRVTAR